MKAHLELTKVLIELSSPISGPHCSISLYENVLAANQPGLQFCAGAGAEGSNSHLIVSRREQLSLDDDKRVV